MRAEQMLEQVSAKSSLGGSRAVWNCEPGLLCEQHWLQVTEPKVNERQNPARAELWNGIQASPQTLTNQT